MIDPPINIADEIHNLLLISTPLCILFRHELSNLWGIAACRNGVYRVSTIKGGKGVVWNKRIYVYQWVQHTCELVGPEQCSVKHEIVENPHMHDFWTSLYNNSNSNSTMFTATVCTDTTEGVSQEVP